MTLAELYAALEGLEKGSEFITTIKAEITRLNNEAKTHREGKEAAEAAVAKLTGERDALTAKVQEIETAEAGTNKALEKQVEALKKQVDAAETARKEAENKRIQADITAQVVDALTKGNAADPKAMAGLLTQNIKVLEDGTYSYVKDDGSSLTIQDGAKTWLEGNAWAVKNTQKGGSGRTVDRNPAGNNKSIGLRDAIAARLGETVDN